MKSHLANYVKSLVDLHRLIVAGSGDSPEADELRDEMDLPWARMTGPELRLVDGLAEDLYRLDSENTIRDISETRALIDLHLLELADIDQSMEGDKLRDLLKRKCLSADDRVRELFDDLSLDLRLVGASSPQSIEAPESVSRAVNDAMKGRHWLKALSMMREHESQIPSAELAALRGICWGNLGYEAAAAVFYGCAQQEHPGNIALLQMYLRSLVRLGDLVRAKNHAVFVAHSSANPFARLLAAEILLDIASQTVSSPDSENLRLVVEYVERVPFDAVKGEQDPVLRATASAAYLSAAIAHEALNNREAADDARSKADSFSQDVHGEAETAAPNLVAAIRQQRDVIDSNLLAAFPSLTSH